MAALLETPRSARTGPGGGRLPRRESVPSRRRPRRAPRHRVRAPRRHRRRLPRLHRRQPVRRVAARGAPADAARRRLRQPALRQPDLVGRDRARRAGARGRAALLQRARERVRVHLHAERHGRAAARRRGLSVRAADRFLATFDNHNSVNGIREFARAKGAATAYVPLEAPDLRVADGLLERYLDDAPGRPQPLRLSRRSRTSPASSTRSSGSTLAQERGWDVLLDCAAFVPTSRLDLSVWKPDFVAVSFYKMFGYPTGLGALIARRRDARAPAAPVVQRRHRRRRERPGRHGRAARPAMRCSRTAPSTTSGSRRSRSACATSSGSASTRSRSASRALGTLAARRRCSGCGTRTAARRSASTGRRRGTAAGARSRSTSCTRTAAWSTSASSTVVAAAHSISVRTGCFCNSGAGETAFSLSSDTLIGAEFDEGMILDDYIAARRACPRAARSASRSGSRPTSPTSTASWPSRREFRDVDRGAGRPAAQARLLEAGTPGGRAGAAPAAAPPSRSRWITSRNTCEPAVSPLKSRSNGCLRQHQQQRPLARGRGHRRRAAVDQALVPERLPGPGQADADAAAAADDHLLDGAVHRQVAGGRGALPRRPACGPAGQRAKRPAVRKPHSASESKARKVASRRT